MLFLVPPAFAPSQELELEASKLELEAGSEPGSEYPGSASMRYHVPVPNLPFATITAEDCKV